ncbi:MAG: 2'-5' RNA ligase family protein [Rhizobiaceae bacterium]
MIYVLVYPEFESRLARRIGRFRSAHEPERAKLVPPHITLVFGLKHAVPKSMLALCESVSSNATELTIEFSHCEIAYDPFEKVQKLSLVCGNGKDALTEWHDLLYAGSHRSKSKSELPY